jgi:hypothetical protein
MLDPDLDAVAAFVDAFLFVLAGIVGTETDGFASDGWGDDEFGCSGIPADESETVVWAASVGTLLSAVPVTFESCAVRFSGCGTLLDDSAGLCKGEPRFHTPKRGAAAV